jgi:hypothetical protein
MGTRSKIGILRRDGTVDHIYCHWDGYPEHNGVILFNDYSNINKMNQLIKNGDMSVLCEHIFPDPTKPHSFGTTDEKQDDVCIFYNRERNEDWKHTCPRTSKNLDRFIIDCKNSDCEYAYLYDENNLKWLFSPIPWSRESDMNFTSLKTELMNNNFEVDDSIKEDYIIFDGIELMKDCDYYEFMDCYNSDSDAYFEIKQMLDEGKYNDYIAGLNSYKEETDDNDLKDRMTVNISELKELFKIEPEMEV